MATAVKSLSVRLAEAEAAYHELSIGKSPVEFRDQNGEQLTYNRASLPPIGCIRGEPSASRDWRNRDTEPNELSNKGTMK